jgi:type II secretory pathway component PulF
MSQVSRAPDSFFFIAATPKGGRRFGVRQAINPRSLADTLRKDRLLLLRSWKLPAWASRAQRLGANDQSTFNEVMGQLLTRGVPLVEALEVASDAVSPSAAGIVDRLGKDVSSGASFADACRKAGAFDDVTVSVYRAAERTGDLGGAASQLARTIKRQLAVSRKATTLMIYPAIVLTISIIVSVVMLMVIVPQIGEQFQDLAGDDGVDIPWFSEIVIGAGTFMRDNAGIVFAVAGAIIVAIFILRRSILRAVQVVARNLPLMRELIRAQEITRFFSVMASMTRSGVPLSDALATGNQAVQDPKLREQLETVQRRLESATLLPPATRRLLVAAERTGELEGAFESLAGDSADEVDRRSARLLAALEPALIVLMFLMIGSLVLSIMIPMITTAAAAGG